MAFHRWQGEQLLLFLHLQPKASKTEFCGAHGERLKLRVQAPPIEGRANAEVIAFLAKVFGVPKRDVSVVSGELSREKTVAVKSPKRLPPELELSATP